VLAEQISERGPEVAGREAVQVQDREYLGDLRRAPCVRRQDLRAEPFAFPGVLLDALVVDPRRLDRHRPGPDRHAPLPRVAVAHDQPLAVLVELISERGDVLADLRLERRRNHPTRALPRKTIERDPSLVLLSD